MKTTCETLNWIYACFSVEFEKKKVSETYRYVFKVNRYIDKCEKCEYEYVIHQKQKVHGSLAVVSMLASVVSCIRKDILYLFFYL